MDKERILELAKGGILAEIEKADVMIKKGRRVLEDRSLGIENKVKKSDEEVLEIIEKYTTLKIELNKEFNVIDSLIFGLEFEEG